MEVCLVSFCQLIAVQQVRRSIIFVGNCALKTPVGALTILAFYVLQPSGNHRAET